MLFKVVNLKLKIITAVLEQNTSPPSQTIESALQDTKKPETNPPATNPPATTVATTVAPTNPPATTVPATMVTETPAESPSTFTFNEKI